MGDRDGLERASERELGTGGMVMDERMVDSISLLRLMSAFIFSSRSRLRVRSSSLKRVRCTRYCI